LVIGGLVVDQIKSSLIVVRLVKAATAVAEGDFKEGFTRSQEMIKLIADMWGLAILQMPYPTKEDPVDVFWKSLVFDTGDVRSRSRSTPEMRKLFESWHESLMLLHFHMQIGLQVQNGHPPLPPQAHVLKALQDATPYLK
jgi:hypothetical protein